MSDQPAVFPFTEVVGQDNMKRALLLNVVDPGIGGVLMAAEHPDTPGTLPFRILERDEMDRDVQAFSGVPLRSETQTKPAPELFLQRFHRREPLLHA